MTKRKAIVYDIETIVDVPKNLEEEYNRYKENTKNGFVTHPAYNKIICIAWQVIEYDKLYGWVESTINGKSDNGYVSGKDEKLICNTFLDKLTFEKPNLYIGYNNKSFDNPIIFWKAYQYKLVLIKGFLDTYKFNLFPIYDVKLALSNFDQFPLSMRTACISLGLPDPKIGMDGSDVAELYSAGEYDKIGEYCLKQDVGSTFNLFKYIYDYKAY